MRKSLSTTITTEKATLFALVENVPVDGNDVHVIIQNPLHALRKSWIDSHNQNLILNHSLGQTAYADLFTGYKNVAWPVSNIIHDKFIVNTQSTNPLKIMLCGAHELGTQETESLILDGSYLTAVGYLRPSHDGNFRIAAEMLTTCDKSMLLKKVGDIRASLVSKLIFFGTIAGILCLLILKDKIRKSRRGSDPSRYLERNPSRMR